MTLSVERLTKGYEPHKPLFTELNLSLQKGSRTALVGTSGCGKTTFLRVLAGLVEPDAGTVSLNGEVIGEPGRPVEAWKAGIGLVFQEAALFPHLTVARNIGFGLGRTDSRSSIVGEFLEMVGLQGLGDRYPHELSGGQQQRVGLARALAPRPGFLLLDEPFSGLDSRTKGVLIDDLRRLFDRLGTGILLVTHDEDDARHLVGTILEMEGGRLSPLT